MKFTMNAGTCGRGYRENRRDAGEKRIIENEVTVNYRERGNGKVGLSRLFRRRLLNVKPFFFFQTANAEIVELYYALRAVRFSQLLPLPIGALVLRRRPRRESTSCLRQFFLSR